MSLQFGQSTGLDCTRPRPADSGVRAAARKYKAQNSNGETSDNTQVVCRDMKS